MPTRIDSALRTRSHHRTHHRATEDPESELARFRTVEGTTLANVVRQEFGGELPELPPGDRAARSLFAVARDVFPAPASARSDSSARPDDRRAPGDPLNPPQAAPQPDRR